MQEYLFTKTSHDIRVSVVPQFLDEQSEPSDNYYVWAYTVQVENLSDQQVQLLNRHWVITDAKGHVEEVQGEGVVGEQPVLKPGQGFRYTSGTFLHTPTGMMAGYYEMLNGNGSTFPIEVPAFSLDSPYQLARPN